MDTINPEFIERYQVILERDPTSRVFAPLAEAYRKLGLNSRAFAICKSGLEYHPDFAGGHIAMARTLMDLQETQKAITHLERAVELSPENILAHQLLAELYLHLKMHRKALSAYKMLLFLSPDNAKAQKAVKKLESLSAEDFAEEDFKTPPTSEPVPSNVSTSQSTGTNFRLERFLSLIDAFIVRNDIERAYKTFEEARIEFASHPELKKRLRILKPESTPSEEETNIPPPESRQSLQFKSKTDILKNYLQSIGRHRRD